MPLLDLTLYNPRLDPEGRLSDDERAASALRMHRERQDRGEGRLVHLGGDAWWWMPAALDKAAADVADAITRGLRKEAVAALLHSALELAAEAAVRRAVAEAGRDRVDALGG